MKKKFWIILTAVVLFIIGMFLEFTNGGVCSVGNFSFNYFSTGDYALGVFASGKFAIGIFSVGIFSIGIFSIGIFNVGLYAVGLFVLAWKKRLPKTLMEYLKVNQEEANA